jgi:hypothetical protein
MVDVYRVVEPLLDTPSSVATYETKL